MLERASRPSKAVPHLFCSLWNLSSNQFYSGRLTPAAAGFPGGRKNRVTRHREQSGRRSEMPQERLSVPTTTIRASGSLRACLRPSTGRPGLL